MVEEAKALLNCLSMAARQLDDLYTEIAESQEEERLTGLAQNARDVLKEFSIRARIEKLKELESQFYTSFNGLARKENRNLSIQIDPNSFEVVLIDDEGVILRKEELSAGEKQIFAISILEALARTSGAKPASCDRHASWTIGLDSSEKTRRKLFPKKRVTKSSFSRRIQKLTTPFMKAYKEAFRTLIILYTAQKLAPHKQRKAISGGGHKTHECISA